MGDSGVAAMFMDPFAQSNDESFLIDNVKGFSEIFNNNGSKGVCA